MTGVPEQSAAGVSEQSAAGVSGQSAAGVSGQSADREAVATDGHRAATGRTGDRIWTESEENSAGATAELLGFIEYVGN